MSYISNRSLKMKFTGIMSAAVVAVALCGSVASAAPADGPMAIWAADHRSEVQVTPQQVKIVHADTEADARSDAQSLLVTDAPARDDARSLQHDSGLQSEHIWLGLHHAG